MVHLIKLNNQEETSGRFTNRFNQPITIPEHSEIALLNCNINITTENIVVDTSNNEFVVEVSSGNGRNVVLNIGTYNWLDFRNELIRALNSSLTFAGYSNLDYMSGFQFKAWREKNKLNIAFDRVDTNGYSLDTLSTITNLSHTNGEWEKNTGVQDTWDAWVESARYFTGGCGMFGADIICPAKDMSDPDYANYRILCGLRSISGGFLVAGQRQPGDCKYAIYTELNTGSTKNVYYFRYPDSDGNEVIEETAFECTNGHQLFILLTDGNIVLRVLNNQNNLVVKKTISLTAEYFQQHFYGVASLKRSNSKMKGLAFHPDPFHKASVALEPEHYFGESLKEHNGIDNDTQLGALVATQVSIRMNRAVLTLLGFDTNPASVQRIRGNFLADKDIREVYLPDNIKIETDNIDLQNYDSYTEDKRNILACIPKVQYNDTDTGNITYSTDYPVWMDMRNLNPFTLNTIRISILNYKNEPQMLVPNETDLTILVRSKKNNLN